ncbi:MAG: hypothetical protein ACM3PE_06710 [Deltaproteobacteria bacterium]
MQENPTVSEDRYVEIDAGIKTVLAVLLAVAAGLCDSRLDLVYFTIYLATVTFLLGSDLRFILKNLATYGIFIVFPYLCGLLFSILIQKLLPGPTYVYHFEASLLRMIKIFLIWYICSLYFFTTPLKMIIEIFDIILFPLNYLGIPVAKHLNMVMVVINQLTSSVGHFKQDIMEQVRTIIRNDGLSLKVKLKEMSNILAVFIANSLQKTDGIQEQLGMIRARDYQYRLRVSKHEILATLSFIILLSLLFAS